jgi:hypothetical protein
VRYDLLVKGDGRRKKVFEQESLFCELQALVGFQKICSEKALEEITHYVEVLRTFYVSPLLIQYPHNNHRLELVLAESGDPLQLSIGLDVLQWGD